jgi:hypothetical protein
VALVRPTSAAFTLSTKPLGNSRILNEARTRGLHEGPNDIATNVQQAAVTGYAVRFFVIARNTWRCGQSIGCVYTHVGEGVGCRLWCNLKEFAPHFIFNPLILLEICRLRDSNWRSNTLFRKRLPRPLRRVTLKSYPARRPDIIRRRRTAEDSGRDGNSKKRPGNFSRFVSWL